jgi:hypothetical protein
MSSRKRLYSDINPPVEEIPDGADDDANADADAEDGETEVEEEDIVWPEKIDCLQDLITIGRMYQSIMFTRPHKRPRWNMNLFRLQEMIPILEKLQNMIGMTSIKKTIVDLIVYYLQDFEVANSNMLHTVIEGAPGTGKTEIAKIIGQIYLKLDVLENDKFRIVRRSDLIGGYLGQTAIKTQKIIDEIRGGVLFIDEAYSLGNPEGRDSYSKECIDTLNQNLTENKCNFICIIAGYRESLDTSFFAVNPGLERRFPFRFQVDEYTARDLRNIFLKIMRDNKWTIFVDEEDDVPVAFFEKNKMYFTFNGGDMETLFQMVKIAHSRRVFCLNPYFKKKITKTDLQNALQLFLQNDKVKNRDPNRAASMNASLPMMYL